MATRDVDVRRVEISRIASELLEIAGDGALLELDVESLVKRYKQGLAGAQRVLAAQRVGEMMLRWQEEELHPPGAVTQEVRPEAQAASAQRFEAELAEPEARGPKSVVPGPKVSTWARPATSDAPPAPLYEEEAPDEALVESWLTPGPGSRPPAREVSLSEIDPQFGLRGRPAPLSERPPQAALGPEGMLPAPAALGALAAELDVDVAAVRPRTRGSEAPPPARDAGKSSRPPPGLSDQALVPPGAALSGVGLMVAPASIAPRERVPLPPPPSSTYPLGAVAAATLTPDKRIDSGGARLWGSVGFALLIGLAVAIVVTKPSCMFADPGRPVTGLFIDKHLGVRLTFPERWLHGEDLDDKEKDKFGYTRKISVFYQGMSATDYSAKIEVITLEKEGEIVSEDIARQNGAGQTLDQARFVNCNPIVRGTIRGTRCTSLSQQLGSPAPYSTIEYYFPLGPYTLFARGRVKLPSVLSGQAPGMGGPMSAVPTENQEIMDRLDQIEHIIDSIDLAR